MYPPGSVFVVKKSAKVTDSEELPKYIIPKATGNNIPNHSAIFL
jgi:hypothetical protein